MANTLVDLIPMILEGLHGKPDEAKYKKDLKNYHARRRYRRARGKSETRGNPRPEMSFNGGVAREFVGLIPMLAKQYSTAP